MPPVLSWDVHARHARIWPMTVRRTRGLVSVALLLAPAAAWGQASSLSLHEATTRALEANRTVLAARAAHAIDAAGVDVAGQRPNPEVSVDAERETPHWA